ncbi:Splicing factor [Coemansia sp. RSA 988]|nr:Splicing factor [Coemansia sp. RSA 988]
MEKGELSELDALSNFLETLPDKLEKTPYDHALYIKWMELVRAVGDIDSLRIARQHMCTRLAIPEDMLLEWVADEEAQPNALCDELVLTNVVDIFEKGVAEHVSCSLWQAYIDFAKRIDSIEDAHTDSAAEAAFGSAKYLFSTLQRAADATGSHYLLGNAVWIQFKDIIVQEASRADDSLRYSELVDLLNTLFIERLSQPHSDLEETFAMYSEFTTQHNGSDYEQQMVNANKIVSSTRMKCAYRDILEDSLAKSDGSWDGYLHYIDKLLQDKAAGIEEIAMLYERALAFHCYLPDAWDKYILYMEGAVDNNTQVALDVARRAIRFCPWSGKLWAHVINFTSAQLGHQQATDMYSRAVSTHAVDYSMLELSLAATAWVAAMRLGQNCNDDTHMAELDAACHKSIDNTYSLDMDTADSNLFLECSCASVFVDCLNDVESARRMWTRVCKSRKICANAWVNFAEFELIHGTVSSARSIYRQAAQRRLDAPELVFSAWKRLEYAGGDLSNIYAAERTIALQRRLAQRRIERAIRDKHIEAAEIQKESLAVSQEINAPLTGLAKRRRSGSHQSVQSIDGVVYDSGSGEMELELPPIQIREELMSSGTSTDYTRSSACPKYTRAVFVKGVPLQYGAEDVTSLFGGPSRVEGTTLLTDRQGAFRGQAKVVLSSIDALITALDKNGTKLGDSFISVHIFKAHHHPPKPSVAEVAVEVTGFSPETGNKQLGNIARNAGSMMRVRRNQAGDTAYVVMGSQAAASKAANLFNGRVVDGCILSAKFAAIAEGVKTNRETSSINVKPANFIPRATATSRPAKKVKIARKPQSPPQPIAATSSDQGIKKTNADFRMLFLGQEDERPNR